MFLWLNKNQWLRIHQWIRQDWSGPQLGSTSQLIREKVQKNTFPASIFLRISRIVREIPCRNQWDEKGYCFAICKRRRANSIAQKLRLCSSSMSYPARLLKYFRWNWIWIQNITFTIFRAARRFRSVQTNWKHDCAGRGSCAMTAVLAFRSLFLFWNETESQLFFFSLCLCSQYKPQFTASIDISEQLIISHFYSVFLAPLFIAAFTWLFTKVDHFETIANSKEWAVAPCMEKIQEGRPKEKLVISKWLCHAETQTFRNALSSGLPTRSPFKTQIDFCVMRAFRVWVSWRKPFPQDCSVSLRDRASEKGKFERKHLNSLFFEAMAWILISRGCPEFGGG